ncbi:MAG TPA: hypothetical protein VMX38_17135 [Verrucomicrobiae bacterium]|nr:hypothetical protein [Verrucomicrobiae bacterium]
MSPAPGDYYILSGSYTVRNSSFNTTGVAISEDGFVSGSQITLGGSPDTGNFTVNDWSGIDLEASDQSVRRLV